MSYIDKLRIDEVDYDIKDSNAIHTDEWLDIVYPVGSIYWNKSNSANPSTYLGGEWRAIIDQVLVAAGSTFPIATSGGSKDAVVVDHAHGVSGATSVSGSHDHSSANSGLHGHNIYHSGNHLHLSSKNNPFLTFNGALSAEVVGEIAGTGWLMPQLSSGGKWIEDRSTGDSGSHSHGMSEGGSHTHRININGNHSHDIRLTSASEGVSGTNKNMPPYVTAYCWERIG